MKKYLPLLAFAAVCALSLLAYYVSGLPFERGSNAAFWMLETLIAASGVSVLTYTRPGV